MSIDLEKRLQLSASPTAYVALGGIYFVLSISYLLLYFRSGDDSVLLGAGIVALPGFGCSAVRLGCAAFQSQSMVSHLLIAMGCIAGPD